MNGVGGREDRAGLTDRDVESKAVEQLLDDAEALEARLLVVHGTAGTGKSALLTAAGRLGRERGFLGPQPSGVYEGEEAGGLVPAEAGSVLVDLEYGPGERVRCHGSVGHGHNPASFMAGIGNRVNGE